jgi:hypothetical protein
MAAHFPDSLKRVSKNAMQETHPGLNPDRLATGSSAAAESRTSVQTTGKTAECATCHTRRHANGSGLINKTKNNQPVE